jgi:multidrug efflux pump subunit AcrA (membrane-fusion protein)
VQGAAANVDVVEQGNLVRSAQRLLAQMQAEGTPNEIADAADAVTLALARQAQALAPREASAEKAAVTAAKAELTRANEALSDARDGALAYLPAGEVLYLPGLPRRVDEISVKRGSSITGPVMRVSGATLEISGSATASDADLLEVGSPAILAMPDGDQTATITSILPAEPAAGEPATGRFTVIFAPDALTDEQIQAVQGSNVRVRIPVSSTEGEVLAVPLAALTAGPGGESRVEFDPGDNAETVLVEVTTGLAAEGFVEITAVDGSLTAGDLVVVGR